jgi:CysZ protein
MVVPGIIYTSLFIIGMNYFGQTSSIFIESIILKTGLKSFIDSLNSNWLGFFITMGSFWLWFSPLFAYLHLRIVAIQQSMPFEWNKQEYFKLVIRSVIVNLNNMLWQTVYLIPIVLVCTLPVVGWFTPLFTILMESYYLGFAMMDFGMATEKHNRNFAAYVNRHKGLPIGNGIVFYLLHLIPIIGWFTAPFYALVAAHLNTQEIKDTE